MSILWWTDILNIENDISDTGNESALALLTYFKAALKEDLDAIALLKSTIHETR